MTAAEMMERLDAVVAAQAPDSRYPAAKTLYEASIAGLLADPLPPTVLYGWVLKRATLPDARGRRDAAT